MNIPRITELLMDAEAQLTDMWRVADDSVADYTLQIETAVNFIKRALNTRDPVELARAAMKAIEALEVEYDDSGEDEDYNTLVDDLNAALNESRAHAVVANILEDENAKDWLMGQTMEKEIVYSESIAYFDDYTEEANAVTTLLDVEGPDAAINYLADWHYPGEHETRKDRGCGTADDVYEKYDKDGMGRYVLCVNHGYVGLSYEKLKWAGTSHPDDEDED